MSTQLAPQKITAQEKFLSPAIDVVPSEQEAIAKLAYQLWSERGRPEGSPEEDWFRAEELLRSSRALTALSI
jgi:hypothetical protein